MTNKRRRDKESCAGCHRKRMKPLAGTSTLGYGDVSTVPARVAKRQLPAEIFGLWLLLARPVQALPLCRWRLTWRPIVPS